MELWAACCLLLILDYTVAKDSSSNSTFVVRQVDSCPDVGYFFKRELAPNLVAAGVTCYLCFCKENGTALCWPREWSRCDAENYHHHRVGRQSRYRRSFSDVFIRDATRDFFGKNLPQQCKPYESSFSDGCPPEDWCIGCTICDCDSNGRWDCHILSFCDGKESKKKIKSFKNNKHKKSKKSFDYDSSFEKRKPSKIVTTRTTKKTTTKPKTTSTLKTTTKPKTTKPARKNIRKVVKAKPNNKMGNRANKSPKKLSAKTTNTSKKYPQNSQGKAISPNHAKTNTSVRKIIKKVVATRKPVKLNGNAVKGLKLNPNNNDTVKMGQKIVKQVMTTFKKMLAKEIEKLNETKRAKLMDGKDCGEVKKRNKRTYNVRSKAAARNKNKYNRQGIYQENYTNSRVKRELPRERENVEKVSVITLPTDINEVIPLNVVKIDSLTTSSTDNVTSDFSSTLQPDNYYEYSTYNSNTSWNSTTNFNKSVTVREENGVRNNFISSIEYSKNTFEEIKNDNTKAINSDLIDLKSSRWLVAKIKNDDRKKTVTRLLLPKPSTSLSFENGKNTEKIYLSKMQKKQWELIRNATKTYELTTSKIYKKHCFTEASDNTTDITGLRNILQKLYVELNKTNTTKRKQTFKPSVMKYVRKLFRNFFSKKRTDSHKLYGLGPKEDHTLQILCENIGPCKLKKNSRIVLKYKLMQLNKETNTVLKSIRTVKGLLHLLELPENNKTSFVAKNNSFQNDIQKLGAVLRDYNDDYINSSLTFTQKTQIEYIKKNTQIFVESVKKFADVLTDIIAIIKPKVLYVQSPKSTLKQENHTSITKIKKILYQYNIMQNTFMKKMYELISREEKKNNTTEKTQMTDHVRNLNNSNDMIEKYSRNIIENLKKLKSIAQMASSKRKKRELTGKDSALEYLLTLMEMLIRQNYHLDAVPANDGIDLLIEAIKNAPDIKPIKKKDLEYAPHIPLSKLASIAESSDQQASDDGSDSKRISNEENTTDMEDNGTSRNNIVMDTSPRQDTFNIDANDDDDITQKVYYRAFNKPDNNEDSTTTEYSTITKKFFNDEQEKVGFDKFESYLGDPKKLEVEAAYVEDEAAGDVTTDSSTTVNSTLVSDLDRDEEDHIGFKTRIPTRTTPYIAQSNESSSESQDSTKERRPKLEWIEEAFDKEIRMINASFSTTSVHARRAPQTATTSTAKNIENKSDLTKGHGQLKKTAKKSTPQDVLRVKQMQFLNSLDYGTEKSPDGEPDSKDDSRSDDSFPAYFIE